jgi:hypothetical protein
MPAPLTPPVLGIGAVQLTANARDQLFTIHHLRYLNPLQPSAATGQPSRPRQVAHDMIAAQLFHVALNPSGTSVTTSSCTDSIGRYPRSRPAASRRPSGRAPPPARCSRRASRRTSARAPLPRDAVDRRVFDLRPVFPAPRRRRHHDARARRTRAAARSAGRCRGTPPLHESP